MLSIAVVGPVYAALLQVALMGDSSADIKAVCDYLELVEEEAKYVRLFHTPNPIILTDLYVPILVTRERIYRHVIENLWSYTEDEAELSRVYALSEYGRGGRT